MPGSLLPRSLADELDERSRRPRRRLPSPSSPRSPARSSTSSRQHPSTEVQDAARRARDAQHAWWAAGDAHRRAVLLKGHDLFLERRELLLDAVQSETGKTRGQAFEEVFNSAAATRYAALSSRRGCSPSRAAAPASRSSGAPACAARRRASSASSRRGTTR